MSKIGHAPVALVFHAAGGDDRRGGAAKAHQHGDKRAPGKPQAAQQPVGEEGCARHIPAILQNGEKEEDEQNLRQRVADVHKLRDGVDVVYPRERKAADDRRGLAPRVIARIVHLRGEDDGHRAAAEPRGDAVDGGAPRHAEERAHDGARVDRDELHEAEVHHERRKQAEDDRERDEPRRHAADDERSLLDEGGGESAELRCLPRA